MSSTLTLAGLDGSIPLDFLAALGILRILDESARQAGRPRPRLAWREIGRWRPVLSGPADIDQVVEAAVADLPTWSNGILRDLRYVKREKRGPKEFRGLRVPLGVYRQWVNGKIERGEWRDLDYVTALVTETAGESLSPSKVPSEDDYRALEIEYEAASSLGTTVLQTAFDFTSRNAQFLAQVEFIRKKVDAVAVRAALAEIVPDRGSDTVTRTLGWAPAQDTPAALYLRSRTGHDPTREWLAFRALAFFPVHREGAAAATTACQGRRKAGRFVWPLWRPATRADSVASLLAQRNLARLSRSQRSAFGVSVVFQAGLTKGADGYDGIFAPTELV